MSVKLPKKGLKVYYDEESREYYTKILVEIESGRFRGNFKAQKVPLEKGFFIESLIEREQIISGNNAITMDYIDKMMKESKYVPLKTQSLIDNFSEVVKRNYDILGTGVLGDRFIHLMTLINEYSITHDAFIEWVTNHRYLFESVFYQSTFKARADDYSNEGQRWNELTDFERYMYETTLERDYEENMALVIRELEDILDRFGINHR